MTLVILLFAIGIVLIAAEVIVPGAILGTIGALAMAGGTVLAFTLHGGRTGAIALAVAIGIGVLALFLEFFVLPRTKLGKRAFLTRQVDGVAAAVGEEARLLVGKPAEAVTMLSPSGYVLIDGQRYEAFCQSGQAPAGAALLVTGADRFRLIVTQRNSIP